MNYSIIWMGDYSRIRRMEANSVAKSGGLGLISSLLLITFLSRKQKEQVKQPQQKIVGGQKIVADVSRLNSLRRTEYLGIIAKYSKNVCQEIEKDYRSSCNC